jgi:ketol-acid reductoisomerase
MAARIWYEDDADVAALDGQTVAVVGYGNQGRSWALNLRDAGLAPRICVRADASREQARRDGFEVLDPQAASDADVVCVLIPDDMIPTLELTRPEDGLTIVASGYTLAFGRFDPAGDLGMVAPRMLGPEVRRCYEEGIGFITAVGVHRDVTGTAEARTLAVARAIGGLRQGGIEMTPRQEAVLDLAVEQVLSPIMGHVHRAFSRVLLDQGIPMEAIVAEMSLSGEFERTSRLVRLVGNAVQFDYHSPTSQYGQLSRRDRFDDVDLLPRMHELIEDITSGRFADEWDAERDAGHATLARLKEQFVGDAVKAFEADLRARLGETRVRPVPAS